MNKEIEYLKEHLYEIYKYKKSKKDLTYDMDIEHLLRTCKALDYSQKEIERLNNIINELEKYCIEEIEDYSKEIKSQYITDNTRGQYEGEKVCFEDILGRLQELKGSNKE